MWCAIFDPTVQCECYPRLWWQNITPVHSHWQLSHCWSGTFMIQPLLLHTFPFEHFGDFWKVMLPHREEMSVSATKETLTSLGNQHVCCGAGSCKIQMFFPLFVNGEQEKQWKSKQRGQLGATQFNVHMSCQVSQFKFLYESIILDSAMVFQNLSGLNLSPFFKVPWIF